MISNPETQPGLAEAVRRAVANFGPLQGTLGQTSVFPAVQNGGDYDVVKIEVLGDDLHRLNEQLRRELPHIETHPVYAPHITLGYVKPGLGQQYAGNNALTGTPITLHELMVSDKDGTRTVVPLTGHFAGDAAAKMSGGDVKPAADPTDQIASKRAVTGVPDARQPDHYSCGACATFGVGHGKFGVGPSTLAEWKKALGTTLAKSTDPVLIVRYLRSLGLTVIPKSGLTRKDLAFFVNNDMPVIVCVQDYGNRRQAGASFAYGHYLTVINLPAGQVECQDSSEDNVLEPKNESAQAPGRVVIDGPTFDRIWHDQDEQGHKYVHFGIAVGPGRTGQKTPPADMKAAEPAPIEAQGQAKKRIAGQGAKDTTKAEQLLRNTQAQGAELLGKLSKKALARMLASKDPQKATSFFSDAEKQQLAGALGKTVATANLLGRARVRWIHDHAKQHEAAGGDFSEFAEPLAFERFDEATVIGPMAPTKAVQYFKGLAPALKVKTPEFAKEIGKSVFTAAEATNERMLRKMKQVISDRLEGNLPVTTGADDMDEILADAGVSPKNPQYGEMVFRTNLLGALNKGTMQEMADEDVADDFPAWRYDIVDDDRTGDDHYPHGGNYFANGVDFAEVRDSLVVKQGEVVEAGEGEGRPYNCRCTPTPLYKSQWEKLKERGAELQDW